MEKGELNKTKSYYYDWDFCIITREMFLGFFL